MCQGQHIVQHLSFNNLLSDYSNKPLSLQFQMHVLSMTVWVISGIVYKWSLEQQ